jgi:hypothetical protein
MGSACIVSAEDIIAWNCTYLILFFAGVRPLPIFVIALVAVGGAFLVVAMVITVVVIKKKYSNVKQRKRAYSVANGE